MSEDCVVIGAGHCAAQLVARLRAEGFEGGIRLIGEETHLPYQRPPLSKQFLAGEQEEDRVTMRPADFYEKSAVTLSLGTRVTGVDRDARTVTTGAGETFGYASLVFTTGSRVRTLDIPGHGLDGVHYLRTFEDSRAIRVAIEAGSALAVVGGGYIGLEVAAVAAKAGCKVTVIEREDRILNRVVAPEVSAWFAALHARSGVEILTGASVEGFEGEGRVTGVRLADGRVIDAAVAVVGVGIVPNSELAEAAGLDCDNGIRVDDHCRTSDPAIYAAGDCTNHPCALYGQNVRLESVHNAMSQAKVAAANVAGKDTAYNEAPWFWSDQYDVKLQIVGLSQGYDATVMRGDPAAGKFTVFYLKDGAVIAADTVGDMREHMACRALVGAAKTVDAGALADVNTAVKDL